MSGGADMHLDLGLVEEASQFLRGRVRHTPLDPSPALSALLGVDTWLKLEHLQLTGSFKVRGALFRLARLTDAERAAGVVTASAGNHGKGIAYAARELGIDAEIQILVGPNGRVMALDLLSDARRASLWRSCLLDALERFEAGTGPQGHAWTYTEARTLTSPE